MLRIVVLHYELLAEPHYLAMLMLEKDSVS